MSEFLLCATAGLPSRAAAAVTLASEDTAGQDRPWHTEKLLLFQRASTVHRGSIE